MSDLKIRCSSLGKLMTEPKGKKEFTYFKDGVKISTAAFNKLLLSGQPLNGVTSVCEEIKASGLSETAKTEIRKIWLFDKYGIEDDITTWAIQKGLIQEQEAVTMLANYLDKMLRKNVLRRSNDFITGECDVDDEEIWDTKVSWDIKTFLNSEEEKGYWWQVQGYCWLWNKPAANIFYCLIDTPENLLQQYIDAMIRKLPEFVTSDIIEQAKELVMYQHKFSRIPENERIRIFRSERDPEAEEAIKEKVLLAREYYATLSLSNVKPVEV